MISKIQKISMMAILERCAYCVLSAVFCFPQNSSAVVKEQQLKSCAQFCSGISQIFSILLARKILSFPLGNFPPENQ
jgi:hypothetical protein